MFENKKKLMKIQEELDKLQKEKESLLFIKNELNDSSPKIDVSDVYIWREYFQNYISDTIVRLEVKKITGKNFIGLTTSGYESTLYDIFTGKIVYQKTSTELIKDAEFISDNEAQDIAQQCHWGNLHQLSYRYPDILAYPDKMVPLYVLQNMYYDMNHVDVNAKILKKDR